MQYLPYASKIIAIVQIRHFKLDHVWELFTDQLMTLSYSQPYQRHCFSIVSRPTPSRFGTWQAIQDPKLISGIRAVTHLYSDTVTDMHMVMDSFSSHIASLAIFLRDLSFKSCMSAFLLLTRLPIWMYPYLFVNINLLSVINSKFLEARININMYQKRRVWGTYPMLPRRKLSLRRKVAAGTI